MHPVGCNSLSKTPWEVSEGRSPPIANPNPATCAVGSEALRSKAFLTVFSGRARRAQEKTAVSAEKIAAGELFRRGFSP